LRWNRREIPPLRADSFARAKLKKKRRLAPVGMTVLNR
jgi:hypothetical protein